MSRYMQSIRSVFMAGIILLGCLPQTAVAQQKQEAQVRVRIATTSDQDNLILYRPGSPLKIRDFKGKPDETSPGVGATYSGILMEMEGQETQGLLTVTVTLTIYFDRSRSWMKKEGRNTQVLAHEQLHFDLTTIRACALARAIAQETYTAATIRQRLRELQQQYTQELGREQQDYDRETHHGTLDKAQKQWAQHTAGELAAQDCW